MRVLKKSITLPTKAASRRAAPKSDVQPDADLLQALTSELKEAHDAFSQALALDDKNYVRGIHMSAKQISPGYSPSLVRQRFELRKQYFKTGAQIDPNKIQPKLYLAEGTFWEDLFKITRACWSMPYNKGYGRRLRFVVFDDYHEAVMGVIGLQSPPADLKSRDDLFSCVPDTKLAMVNNTMDAFTVVAIPPYSFLLGGKLCAGMISTETIRRAYWRKYAGKKSTTQDSTIPQPLVAVTTTSAFGRSSIYNRLKYKDRLLAEPIGYTQGFGTIHLEHLYPRIVELLKSIGKFTPAGWGNGPKVRWQNIANALTSMGISGRVLRHGLQREVFLFRFVDQLEQGMAGGSYGAPISLEETDFADYWKTRWALPRAERFPDWSSIDSATLIKKKLLEVI